MKKYILSILILSALFLINGCYTVIWMPDEQFPSEVTTNEYYDQTYYGDYYGFYDYPWWMRLAPPSTPIGSDYIRNENGTTSSLRNEGEGRNTDTGRKVLQTAPPSRDSNSGTSTNETNSSSNNNNNSSSVNSNSNSNTRNSDSNSIRNNDGNRNSNSGRR